MLPMSMLRLLYFVMHVVAERMNVLTSWPLSSLSLTALPQHGRKHWNLLLQLWPLFGNSYAHSCMSSIGNNHSIAVKFRGGNQSSAPLFASFNFCAILILPICPAFIFCFVLF